MIIATSATTNQLHEQEPKDNNKRKKCPNDNNSHEETTSSHQTVSRSNLQRLPTVIFPICSTSDLNKKSSALKEASIGARQHQNSGDALQKTTSSCRHWTQRQPFRATKSFCSHLTSALLLPWRPGRSRKTSLRGSICMLSLRAAQPPSSAGLSGAGRLSCGTTAALGTC